MRLPSVRYVTDIAAKTFRRFPYVLALAVATCLLACWMVDQHDVDSSFTKLLLTLSLGIPLLLSLLLMRERRPLTKLLPPWFYGPFGILLLALLFTTLYLHPAPNYSIYYIQWLLPSVILVSFAAHLRRGETLGFWHFNRRLVTRFLLSGLYTLVFFAGVSAALAAIDKLLGVDINHLVYERLWIFAAYVFFVWHFLAGVPEDFQELQQDDSYPKALKVFTQYLLVPLATVYYLILYVYLGKILVTQQWPSGWISWLTTSASILGLITFLLFFPIRDREGHGWIAKYSRGFCTSALPLLGMLFVSIFKRMDQYGLTERRYFLLVLALWLLGLFLYFIFSKAPEIRWVPATFCVVAVLTSFGPWGAYDVSFKSQQNRLRALFEKNGMWVGGKAVKASTEVSFEDRKQISACLDYAGEYHGLMRLQPLFNEDLKPADNKAQENRWNRREATKKVLEPLGINYASGSSSDKGDQAYFNFVAEDPKPLEVGGYASVSAFNGYMHRNKPCDAAKYEVSFVPGEKPSIRICRNGVEKMGPSLAELLNNLREKYPQGGTVPQSALVVEANGMKICFQNLNGNWNAEKKTFTSVGGNGLLFLKNR